MENKAKQEMKTENIHKHHRQRMREKFDETGFKGWSKYEILEYMLYNVYAQKDTNPIAHKLLEYSGKNFVQLFKNAEDFRMKGEIDGVGERTILFLRSLKSFMDYYEEERLKSNPIRLSSDNVLQFVSTIEFSNDTEEIVMICMDRFMRVKCISRLTDRSEAGFASVKIDKMVKVATQSSAANVILVHNHPSGYVDVSDADIFMTDQAQKILATFQISLIDHFVWCDNRIISVKMTVKKMFE